MSVEEYTIIYTDTEDNDYDVPKKQWDRWTFAERKVFNIVFSSMTDDPKLFQHPDANIKYEHWVTTAWNAAWNAAELIGKHFLEEE